MKNKIDKKNGFLSIQVVAVMIAMAAIVICSVSAIMYHDAWLDANCRLEKIIKEKDDIKRQLASSANELEKLKKQKPTQTGREKPSTLTCGNPGTIARRFNNPCNVKTPLNGGKWKGQIGSDDKRHVHFQSVFHGIRATAITLRSYAKKHKIKTIQALIDRYCGGNPGYVKFLCEELHLKPDQEFNIMAVLPELVWLMSQYESGRRIPSEWVVTLDLARE